jgi:hypothetical protein
MAKAAFNKKRAVFTGKINLKIKKKLLKCHICSTYLCGAGTGTVRAVGQF